MTRGTRRILSSLLLLWLSTTCMIAEMARPFPAFFKSEPNPSTYPLVELSGGLIYAYTTVAGPINPIGWHVVAGINPTRSLRLIGDFAHEGTVSDTVLYSGSQASIQDYQYVMGPQFIDRRHPRLNPFAHTLFGVAERHYTVSSGHRLESSVARDFGFAYVLGGGLDVNVNQRIAIRVIQADVSIEHRTWVDPQRIQNLSQLPAPASWEIRPRLSCGIVFRLGYHRHW